MPSARYNPRIRRKARERSGLERSVIVSYLIRFFLSSIYIHNFIVICGVPAASAARGPDAAGSSRYRRGWPGPARGRRRAAPVASRPRRRWTLDSLPPDGHGTDRVTNNKDTSENEITKEKTRTLTEIFESKTITLTSRALYKLPLTARCCHSQSHWDG
jgi:hypothetical protein